MTEFVHESGRAGKIKKFLIYLFAASILLLQYIFVHGSPRNRHGKKKLLNVSDIFGISLKLVFVLNCWFLKNFTNSVSCPFCLWFSI